MTCRGTDLVRSGRSAASLSPAEIVSLPRYVQRLGYKESNTRVAKWEVYDEAQKGWALLPEERRNMAEAALLSFKKHADLPPAHGALFAGRCKLHFYVNDGDEHRLESWRDSRPASFPSR